MTCFMEALAQPASVIDVAINMIIPRFVTDSTPTISSFIDAHCNSNMLTDYKIAKKRALSQYATQCSSFY